MWPIPTILAPGSLRLVEEIITLFNEAPAQQVRTLVAYVLRYPAHESGHCIHCGESDHPDVRPWLFLFSLLT
jgi:hypothetical protein